MESVRLALLRQMNEDLQRVLNTRAIEQLSACQAESVAGEGTYHSGPVEMFAYLAERSAPANLASFVISYEEEAHVAYIRLSWGSMRRAISVTDNMTVELDADENIIGIQLLDVRTPVLLDAEPAYRQIQQKIDVMNVAFARAGLKLAEYESLSWLARNSKRGRVLLSEAFSFYAQAAESITEQLKLHGA
jgi:uncharacterized protein YuzE